MAPSRLHKPTKTQTTTCRSLAATGGGDAEQPPPRTAVLFFFPFSSDDVLRRLNTQHLLSVTGALDEESVWGMRRRVFTGCERPLVEQSQHCDVILEFFYKYLIRKQEKKKSKDDGTFYYNGCSCWETSLFVLDETEKVSNKFDVLACFRTKNYPGDSIDCQLQLRLQYLYPGNK